MNTQTSSVNQEKRGGKKKGVPGKKRCQEQKGCQEQKSSRKKSRGMTERLLKCYYGKPYVSTFGSNWPF
jgi:hypothetical protein